MNQSMRGGRHTVEDLLAHALLAMAGAALLAGLLLWTAGALGGLLVHGAAPPVPPSLALQLLVRLPDHMREPAMARPVAARSALPPAGVLYALIAAEAALVVAAMVAVVSRMREHRRATRQSRSDRSLGWATRRQVRELVVPGPCTGRLVLGRLGRRWVAAEPRRSVMVVAPTQAGKTTRFVIPNVATWHGPLVVTSVKTDVLTATLATRRSRGVVHVFDPTGSTGLETAKWNPLLACSSYADAERTASWLVEAASESRYGENARFWESLGAKLLAPLLLAAACADGTMTAVARWVDRREVDQVTEILTVLGDEDALNAWSASCAREPRQRDSVYATAETVLRAFTSPSVRQASAPSVPDHLADRVLHVGRLLDAAETLYLVAPAHEQSRLRPLFESLVQAVLRAAQDRYATAGQPLDPPLLLMLDEAANVAPLRDLATHASTGAGQGTRSARCGRTLRRWRQSTGDRPQRW